MPPTDKLKRALTDNIHSTGESQNSEMLRAWEKVESHPKDYRKKQNLAL